MTPPGARHWGTTGTAVPLVTQASSNTGRKPVPMPGPGLQLQFLAPGTAPRRGALSQAPLLTPPHFKASARPTQRQPSRTAGTPSRPGGAGSSHTEGIVLQEMCCSPGEEPALARLPLVAGAPLPYRLYESSGRLLHLWKG